MPPPIVELALLHLEALDHLAERVARDVGGRVERRKIRHSSASPASRTDARSAKRLLGAVAQRRVGRRQFPPAAEARSDRRTPSRQALRSTSLERASDSCLPSPRKFVSSNFTRVLFSPPLRPNEKPGLSVQTSCTRTSTSTVLSARCSAIGSMRGVVEIALPAQQALGLIEHAVGRYGSPLWNSSCCRTVCVVRRDVQAIGDAVRRCEATWSCSNTSSTWTSMVPMRAPRLRARRRSGPGSFAGRERARRVRRSNGVSSSRVGRRSASTSCHRRPLSWKMLGGGWTSRGLNHSRNQSLASAMPIRFIHLRRG